MVDYSAYLQSPEWRQRRSAVLDAAGYVCACCHEHASEVHHRTYVRLGNEVDADLMAVCRTCHERITDISREAIAEGPSVADACRNYAHAARLVEIAGEWLAALRQEARALKRENRELTLAKWEMEKTANA